MICIRFHDTIFLNQLGATLLVKVGNVRTLQEWVLEVHADFVQAIMEIDKEGVGDKRSVYIDILKVEPGAEIWRLQF